MQRIADVERETDDPIEFLEALKLDLEQDEVYVFTPKGKVIALPARSTPVDFAYAIHTEVGHRCIGARVNGRLVPLDTQLTRPTPSRSSPPRRRPPGPSRDWLQIVASTRARNKIRQWFSRERREDAIENGREELARALRRDGLPLHKLAGLDARSTQVAESHEPRRPRRALRRHRREPGLGPVRSSSAWHGSCAAAETRRAAADDRARAARSRPGRGAARAPASTSRASTT